MLLLELIAVLQRVLGPAFTAENAVLQAALSSAGTVDAQLLSPYAKEPYSRAQWAASVVRVSHRLAVGAGQGKPDMAVANALYNIVNGEFVKQKVEIEAAIRANIPVDPFALQICETAIVRWMVIGDVKVEIMLSIFSFG